MRDPYLAVGGLGLLTVMFAGRAFLGHGGARVTVLGVFNAAAAMFVGIGGIQEFLHPQHRTSPGYLVMAMLAAYLTQVVTTCVAWRRCSPMAEPIALWPERTESRWVHRCGWGTLLALFIARLVEVPVAESPWAEGGAFVSVSLIAAGAFLRTDARRHHILPVTVGFLIYAAYFHGGTGRLRMMALVCVIMLLFTARFPQRLWKLSAIASVPLVLIALANYRLSLQESLKEGASAGRTGLESMTDPIVVFSQVIEQQAEGPAPPALGWNLLSLVFAWLPKDRIEPWMPNALGYELVRITKPESYGSGYSVAGTVYGEWWYNFSAVGIPLSILFIVALVGFLDRRIDQSLRCAYEGRFAILKAVAWTMTGGAIADLAWAGLHSYGARVLVRLLVLLAALGVAYTSTGRAPAITPPSRAHVRIAGGDRKGTSSSQRHAFGGSGLGATGNR